MGGFVGIQTKGITYRIYSVLAQNGEHLMKDCANWLHLAEGGVKEVCASGERH